MWILRFFLKKLFPFIDWSNKNLPEGIATNSNILVPISFQPGNGINLDTSKLKRFDLIDFTGWTIKGYTSGCKNIGIETSEFVTIELNYFLVCCFIPYMRWDFIQLSFYLFLIAMAFFPNSTKVRHFPYKFTCPTFVLVQCL